MEPKQFEPNPYKWEQRFITAVIILSTVLVLGYDWIRDNPPKPPPHENLYNYGPPEPLGPARKQGAGVLSLIELETMYYDVANLHALSINGIRGEVDTKEIAIFVGAGWDCILATEEKGCIIK